MVHPPTSDPKPAAGCIPTSTVGCNDGVHRQPPRPPNADQGPAGHKAPRSDNPNRPATASPSQACQRRLAYVTMPPSGGPAGASSADAVGGPGRYLRTFAQTKTTFLPRQAVCSISGLSIATDVDNGRRGDHHQRGPVDGGDEQRNQQYDANAGSARRTSSAKKVLTGTAET